MKYFFIFIFFFTLSLQAQNDWQTWYEKSDSIFAASPMAILKWFYQHSPYWDDHLNLYPVGRIMNPKIVRNLELK